MRFVIVGAGRVGIRTARVLREEGHEITLVEPEPTRVDRLRDEGFDVAAGDGTSESTLAEAGIEEADGLAALSGDFEVNILACTIAKGYDCRTVLRITREYHESALRKHASDIDEIVFPERLGSVVAIKFSGWVTSSSLSNFIELSYLISSYYKNVRSLS
jgi:trk system potassium uptake protein TrkA